MSLTNERQRAAFLSSSFFLQFFGTVVPLINSKWSRFCLRPSAWKLLCKRDGRSIICNWRAVVNLCRFGTVSALRFTLSMFLSYRSGTMITCRTSSASSAPSSSTPSTASGKSPRKWRMFCGSSCRLRVDSKVPTRWGVVF